MAKIFKYFSQIFVVKEREMEIGFPTDVKHVAHIGWDGPSDTAPSWMNKFKNEPDFSTLSRNNNGNRRDSSGSLAASAWASQDFESSMARQPSTRTIDLQPNDIANANAPKKSEKKKVKSSSSSSSSSRSSRHSKTSKATYMHMEPTPNLLV